MKKIFTPLLIIEIFIVAALYGIFAYTKYYNKTMQPADKGSIELRSVVRLVRDGKTFCSGVVIDDSTILTAGHCLSLETPFGAYLMNPNPIEIRGPDNRPLAILARAAGLHPLLDRGILKGDFSSLPKSRYISDVEENVSHRVRGAKFIACGYPLGGELYCSNMVYLRDSGFLMEVLGVLIPGMSGGPVMLPDGRVIATNTSVAQETSQVSPIYGIDEEK